MKSSPHNRPDGADSVDGKPASLSVDGRPPGLPNSKSAPIRLFAKLRGYLRQFKADLREPIPGTEGLTRPKRIKARLGLLYRKYGWKLLTAIFIYYLIRDTTLYIIIPYLIARGLLAP